MVALCLPSRMIGLVELRKLLPVRRYPFENAKKRSWCRFHHDSTRLVLQKYECGRARGPIEAVAGFRLEFASGWLPRSKERGLFISPGRGKTSFVPWREAAYSAVARAMRFDSREMPVGSRTFHWLSLSSTRRKMEASQGGWSAGESIRIKSGPMCVMRMAVPSTIKRIITWAECAP